MGYDGKGQWILRTAQDVLKAKSELPPVKLILERFVPFTRELSVLAVRSHNGETAIYPLVENHHRNGILRLSLAPAPRLDPEIQRAAERAAQRVLESLKYVGVLAIEFFEHQGELLANEMAPRVHNSRHWTIERALMYRDWPSPLTVEEPAGRRPRPPARLHGPRRPLRHAQSHRRPPRIRGS